jgi:hypothetical protein
MKDIKIVKNFLPGDYVADLTHLFLPPGETKEFPWFYNPIILLSAYKYLYVNSSINIRNWYKSTSNNR